MNEKMTLIWLIAMIVLLIVEGIIPGLVSIWFAAGALISLVLSLFNAPLWLQIAAFLVSSVVLLCLTRPMARKYVNSRVTPTNADRIIGSECVVIEEIDNVRGTGAVTVDGKTWTARMVQADGKAAAGEIVKAVRIEGVRLIVSKE